MQARRKSKSEPLSASPQGVVQGLVEFALSQEGAKLDDFRGQSAVCVQTTPFLLTGADGVVLLRIAPATQSRIVCANPTAACPSEGRWGRVGWTRVQVRHLAPAMLKELVREAHRLAAGRYRGRD